MNPVLTILYILACGAAIFFWRHYKHTPAWVFMPFLVFVLINDVLGMYLATLHLPRMYTMNIYLIIAFGVYFYWFYKTLKRPRWMYLFVVSFFLVLLYDLICKDFINMLWQELMVVIAIQGIVCTIIYFKSLLFSKKVIEYYKQMSFWIATGYVFFFVGALPLIFFRKMIIDSNLVDELYNPILTGINFIYYSSFIIAFYVSRVE